ncbi:hypothetical protein MAR_036337 [Mya arenaria]|uniref:Uncharacterized protein n=1 Tax=Mya arenaria TaxID=6604 RepID=A0ABY7EVP6_MYAAR|nr:hypothetical protein MAR_036337 [Mya arenaria]
MWQDNDRFILGLTCKCALGYTVFANISCNSHCNDSNFEFPCGIAETNIMSVYNTDNERIISQTDDTCTSIECSCLSFTYNNTPSDAYIFKWKTCMDKEFSFQPLCNNHNFSGSTAGLAAGLSVSLVLLILGAIIVLLFLKRRGFLPECHKQTEETSNHSADTATDNSFMSTPIFESTTNTMHDLAASNHTYLALERTFDGVNKDDADQYAELDATEFDHYD